MACDIEAMDDRYKCHAPARVKTIRPLAAPAARPRPAESIARDGARPPGQSSRRAPPREIDGPSGPEPTRYGDWEINGRCVDF